MTSKRVACTGHSLAGQQWARWTCVIPTISSILGLRHPHALVASICLLFLAPRLVLALAETEAEKLPGPFPGWRTLCLAARLLGREAWGETLERPVSLGYPTQGENYSWYLQLTTSGKVAFQTHKPSSSPLPSAPSPGRTARYNLPFLQSQEPLWAQRCTQVWLGGRELKVRYSPRLEMGFLCGGGGLAVNPLQC